MKIAAAIAGTLLIVMLGALFYGFRFGDGWTEVGELMDYPWFVVTLFDIYTGFILFSVWIASREKPLIAALWILLLMSLGNPIACLYVLYAIWRHKAPPLAQNTTPITLTPTQP